MSNPGAVPVDGSTAVGQFRALYPDMDYVALDPPVADTGDFTNFSDAEITAFLALSNASPARAIGWALLTEANTASRESQTVKDYDLSIDLTKRASDLRAQASEWFALADSADLDGEDAFIIVPTGKRPDCWPPELAPIWIPDYRSPWC